MSKKWKPIYEQCEFCGSDAEICTIDHQSNGIGYDSDSIRCTVCSGAGHFTVYEDGEAGCNWDYETAPEGS